MTRMEKIARITHAIGRLDDDQLEGLEQLASSLVGPSVYSTLPDADRAAIDAALARLDRGEGVSGPQAMSELRAGIAAARAAVGQQLSL